MRRVGTRDSLSDHHASVLAALHPAKGSAGESLDELLSAAGDVGPGNRLEEEIEKAGTAQARKPSLDDLTKQKPKRDWPS